jgi:hypothetical protein
MFTERNEKNLTRPGRSLRWGGVAMSSRSIAVLSTLAVLSCQGSTVPPYATANDPTLIIEYPTSGDVNICMGKRVDLPAAADTGGTVPVWWAALNAPDAVRGNDPNGFAVLFTADRDTGRPVILGMAKGAYTKGGDIDQTKTQSPFTIDFARTATLAGPHVLDGEIVHADGSALDPSETINLSHKMHIYFTTKARAACNKKCPAFNAPTGTAVTADHGPAAGGNTVIISGSNFHDADSIEVDFGTASDGTGNASPTVTIVDDMTLTAVVPAALDGTASVKCTKDGDCAFSDGTAFGTCNTDLGICAVDITIANCDGSSGTLSPGYTYQ